MDDRVFLSYASNDFGNARRVGEFIQKFLEEHGQTLVWELPTRTGDVDFLTFARDTVSDLTWGDVREAQVVIQTKQAPAAMEQELEQSRWGTLVTTLRDNGLNAGQIITIVLTLIMVILSIRENQEPQPQQAPAPNVEVNVDVPTDEIIGRVIQELEKREQAPQRPTDH